MAVTISVTLSDRQYDEAKKEAEKLGISISQYVKITPIVDSEFEERYEFLKKQAKTIDENKPFTVMSIFSDWFSIERGIRLSLGRNFFHAVNRGEIPGVVPAGKNSSNVQLYERRK